MPQSTLRIPRANFTFTLPPVHTPCDRLSLAYRLRVTADGFLATEDRRIVSSLDQSLLWACHLCLTDAHASPLDREKARLITEFAAFGAGSISRLPSVVVEV